MKKLALFAAFAFMLLLFTACENTGSGLFAGSKKPDTQAEPTALPTVSATPKATPTDVPIPAQTGNPDARDGGVTPTVSPRDEMPSPTKSIIIGKSDNFVTDREKKALLDSIEKEVNSLAKDIAALEEPSDQDLYYN